MRILLAVLCALGGLALGSQSEPLLGMLAGFALGYLIGAVQHLQERLSRAEGQLDEALRRLAARAAVSPPHSSSTESSAQPTLKPAAGVQGAMADARPAAAPPERAAAPARPVAALEPAAAPGSAATWAHDTYADNTRAAQPSAPEPVFVRLLRDYFTGGNTLVRVGIIILFFGVAFLVRYVAERTTVPIEMRLLAVVLGAIAMLALGWRLRRKRPGYALALQGGAIGILYLTVFAALRLYELLPPAAAFALLVFIVIFSAMLAVLQNSLELAVLGIVGGFLAPVLASTGQGSHVVLFSYYALLNAGIVGIAWFKAWRPLNALGFLFTFVIGTVWGVLRYRSELFASTEPFLILFFLYYVALAVLFASRQPPQLKGYVDGSLVFGTPIVAFALQSAMLRDRPYALAFSALVASALYLSLAWTLHRSRGGTYRLLVEAFMALGVVFLTLAVPLALDGRWTAATWALEGAALVWVGCRQDRKLPRIFGVLLQVAGGIIFWKDVEGSPADFPLLNSVYLGGVMISAAAVFSTRMLERSRQTLSGPERPVPAALFMWGLVWWLSAGAAEILRQISSPYQFAALLVFLAATALISSELVRRQEIAVARWPALGLLPAMVFFSVAAVFAIEGDHPFGDRRGLAWLCAFAVFYLVCRRHEPAENTALARALHLGSALLLMSLVSWELAWWIDELVRGSGSWPLIAWAIVPAVTLAVLPQLKRLLPWPVGAHWSAYVDLVGGITAVYLLLWVFGTNLSSPGDPYPLPYVPLLNPLDVAEVFVLLVLVRYPLMLQAADVTLLTHETQRGLALTTAAAAFVWINAVLLRTLHHWADVPFDSSAMLASTLVQTSLSIFWTLLALTTMLLATRRTSRFAWLAGAALLAVVVVKLFLVDLSRVGTVERIVSFVAVGVLMLVIGYFSPLPPAERKSS
jgi:uncharacterized membrane protein